MPIVVNLDVMLAKRKMRSRELAEQRFDAQVNARRTFDLLRGMSERRG